jgi:hypothetical protein
MPRLQSPDKDPGTGQDLESKNAFAVALNEHLINSTPKRDECSREGRARNIRFKWLAMSLEPEVTIQQIADQESIDHAAVTRGINKARLDLTFPPDKRAPGRIPYS